MLMTEDSRQLCHGRYDCIQAGSAALSLGPLSEARYGLRNFLCHLVWHLKDKGVLGTMKLVFSKFGILSGSGRGGRAPLKDERSQYDGVLNLMPGELVEVKGEQEVLATLDENGRNKGLLWMNGMRKFCGKRCTVFRRLETVLLESNGELRRMENTVLLKNVICDGKEFYDCDRSCFYYWREAWLRRAEK